MTGETMSTKPGSISPTLFRQAGRLHGPVGKELAKK